MNLHIQASFTHDLLPSHGIIGKCDLPEALAAPAQRPYTGGSRTPTLHRRPSFSPKPYVSVLNLVLGILEPGRPWGIGVDFRVPFQGASRW